MININRQLKVFQVDINAQISIIVSRIYQIKMQKMRYVIYMRQQVMLKALLLVRLCDIIVMNNNCQQLKRQQSMIVRQRPLKLKNERPLKMSIHYKCLILAFHWHLKQIQNCLMKQQAHMVLLDFQNYQVNVGKLIHAKKYLPVRDHVFLTKKRL